MFSSRILSVVLSLACPALLAAADWPQFRGPNASGVAADAVLPTKWDVEQGTNIRWQTRDSRDGPCKSDRSRQSRLRRHGGFAGETGAQGRSLRRYRFGERSWSGAMAIARARQERRLRSSGMFSAMKRCRASNAIQSEPLQFHACHGRRADRRDLRFGRTFCFDRDGKLLWKKDLGPMDSGYFLFANRAMGICQFADNSRRESGRAMRRAERESSLRCFDLADGRRCGARPEGCADLEHAHHRASWRSRRRFSSTAGITPAPTISGPARRSGSSTAAAISPCRRRSSATARLFHERARTLSADARDPPRIGERRYHAAGSCRGQTERSPGCMRARAITCKRRSSSAICCTAAPITAC